MKNIRTCSRLGHFICLIAAGAFSFPAYAEDQWQTEASINLWLPSIGGTTSFPPTGGGPTIDIGADKILDALKMTFMGTLDVKKGQWGFFTDVAYVDLGDSKNGTRDFTLGDTSIPAALNADLSMDIKATVWTLAGTRNIVTTPNVAVDVMAGARLLDIKQSLSYQLIGTVGPGFPLPARIGSSETRNSNWDAVIGIKGRAHFGAAQKWFVPYYLDIGTGDSDLTWQAVAGAGYQFNWGSISATWRYLDYQLSGTPVESVNFNGPAIVAAFQW